MNLSLKGGTVCLCGSIKIEDTHKNVFPVRSLLLHFRNKNFERLRIRSCSDIIFDLRGTQE